MKLLHDLSLTKKPCRKHLRWQGDTLRCGVCGHPAGFRWRYKGEIRVYLFSEFKDLQAQVERAPETKTVRGSEDLLNDVSFREFDEFIENVRSIRTEETAREAELERNTEPLIEAAT